MLPNGETAPLFTLPSMSGDVSLPDTGGKPVVIIFFRGRFCETTGRFLITYQETYSRMKEPGMEILCISSDDLDEIKATSESLRLSLPLLSDPECTTGELQGVCAAREKTD